MKKILLLAAFGLLSMAGFAQTNKTYTDDLVVSLNEVVLPSQKSDIEFVNNGNGTCNFLLKNFILGAGEDVIPVGNIVVNNVPLKEDEGYNTFSTEQVIEIQPGDDPSIEWGGPDLGPVPLKMEGKINEEKLYCTIDIKMLGMDINVLFGQDITNGISQIVVTPTTPVDVYSVSGVCLRQHVAFQHALEGLQPGIYIVNGMKIVKK